MDYDTPTSTLLKEANELSVHQLIAYRTILTVHKTMQTKKPNYIFNKLKPNKQSRSLRNDTNLNTKADLTVTRGGFIYRASKLYNMIPIHMKQLEKYNTFKSKIKTWIRQNIKIIPN